MSNSDKSFIALLLRSPDQGDGWRKISKAIKDGVFSRVDSRELFETKGDDMIRLSAEGLIVAKYL